MRIDEGCLGHHDAKLSERERIYYAQSHTRDPLLFGHAPRGAKAQYQATLEGCNDARTGMPPGVPGGAMCVQRFDDSLNSAIHITYRISLRSSSMPEPRDPLLKVFFISIYYSDCINESSLIELPAG